MQFCRTKFRKSLILSNKKWIKCIPGKNPVISRGKSEDITGSTFGIWSTARNGRIQRSIAPSPSSWTLWKIPVSTRTLMDGKKYPLLKGANFFTVCMERHLGRLAGIAKLINIGKVGWKVLGVHHRASKKSTKSDQKNRASNIPNLFARRALRHSGWWMTLIRGPGTRLHLDVSLWKYYWNVRQKRCKRASIFFFEKVDKNIVWFFWWNCVPCDGKRDLKNLKDNTKSLALLAGQASQHVNLDKGNWRFYCKDFSEKSKEQNYPTRIITVQSNYKSKLGRRCLACLTAEMNRCIYSRPLYHWKPTRQKLDAVTELPAAATSRCPDSLLQGLATAKTRLRQDSPPPGLGAAGSQRCQIWVPRAWREAP